MTKSRGIYVRRGTRLAWVEENQGRHLCGCGCGEPVPIRAEHFNVGVPKFRHGHNPPHNAGTAPKRVGVPCACGCGTVTTPGRRYVSGHNNLGQKRTAETRRKISEGKRGAANPQFGKVPPNYVGRWVTKDGYVLIHVPQHPFGGRHGMVMEHRLVIEAHLRQVEPDSLFLTEVDGVRYLARWVEVHHVNGVKDDNRVANLVAMSKRDHAKLHAHEKRRKDN